MFTSTFKRQAIALAVIAILVTILLGATAFGRVPSAADRANAAWTQRLNGIYEQSREARAMAAWSARLMGEANRAAQAAAGVNRATTAYSLRLSGLAAYLQPATGMSVRAMTAWTDRLNGLAQAEAASK